MVVHTQTCVALLLLSNLSSVALHVTWDLCLAPPPAQVGSGSGLGGCRASCKSCEQCALGDEACYVRNREAGGFLVVDDAELAGQI